VLDAAASCVAAGDLGAAARITLDKEADAARAGCVRSGWIASNQTEAKTEAETAAETPTGVSTREKLVLMNSSLPPETP
jgi:hypothetical protein